MNPDDMTIEQHLTVLYLLDVAQGEGISTVDVDGFSNLPEGAVLLRLTQTSDSEERAALANQARESLAGSGCGVVRRCLVPAHDAQRSGLARASPPSGS